MKFCTECGYNVEGLKFCPECGNKIGESAAVIEQKQVPAITEENVIKEFSTYLFGLEGQKRNVGKFDVNIPQFNYTITSERLIIEKQGVVTKKNDYIELYLIKDINLIQNMKDKLLKMGSLEIISVDPSTPVITLKQIQNPQEIREILRNAVRQSKKTEGVAYRQEL